MISQVGYSEASHGDAFIGMIIYNHPYGLEKLVSRNYREYIAVKLNEELVKDSLYELSLSVKLAETKAFCIDYFEVIFFDSPLVRKNSSVLKPDKNSTSVKIDLECNVLGWYDYKVTFVANGRETYLIAGNFKNKTNSNTWIKNGFNINTNRNRSIDRCYIFLDSFNLVKIPSNIERAKTPRKL